MRFETALAKGLASAALLACVQVAGCAGSVRKPLQLRPMYSPAVQSLVGPAITVVAAGDIACDPNDSHFNGGLGTRDNCHMKATSDIVLRIRPAAVLALGDTQYQRGHLSAYRLSYDPTWGRLRDITYPVAGNHEYRTVDAAGYFAYFGAAARPLTKGYYSYDLGAWHLIALNANCKHVGGCGPGSPQEQWLRRDLEAHKGQCTLAYWHQPRFSSGWHGSGGAYRAFWRDLYDAGADLVLAGHDHDYEAFAPQDPDGRFDPQHGIRELVVGTGGKNHLGFFRFLPFPKYRNSNSEVANAKTFGVLRLELYRNGFEWHFEPEAGEKFTDSGTGWCHYAAR